MWTTCSAAISLSLMLASAAQAGDPEADRRAVIVRADAALMAKQPQSAIEAVEPVIAAYEAELRNETRTFYCGMTGAQTLAYMGLAASKKQSAVALGPNFCEALYIKGFALFDLGRIEEAQTIYKRLATLAPMHSHFQLELGMTYRAQRNWQAMLDTCKDAEGLVELSAKDRVNAERGFAWRCMGFALIEQGKLDEAEALFRKCLKLDPHDAKAKNELDYIAQQRQKTART
jgi:tetratricopeptide (TPR) repeat protein